MFHVKHKEDNNMNKYQYAFIQELKPTHYTQEREGALFLIHSVILPYMKENYAYAWENIEWIKDHDINKYNDILGFMQAYIKYEERKLIHKFITGNIHFPNAEYFFSDNHTTAYIICQDAHKIIHHWLAFDLYAVAQSMEILIAKDYF